MHRRLRFGTTARTPAGYALAEIGYPSGLQPPHAHAGASVTLVLRGSVRERAGRQEEIGRPLSVVVKPVGVRHSDEYGGEGLDTLQIAIPPEALDGDAGIRIGGGWRWVHAGPVTAPFLNALQILRTEPEDGVRLEWAICDTIAALERESTGRARGAPPLWLARVRERIDDARPGSLTVESVARQAGVHPVSLTRAFRRHFGVTTSVYLRRARLRCAARLLAETSRPLSRIAFSAGFSDQAHMTRDTRAATGATPGVLRALMEGALDDPSRTRQEAG